jgi:oligosaccharide repeat unit polymerase
MAAEEHWDNFMPVETGNLGLDLALGALALLVMGNYVLRRSILYPPFIFCAMWSMDLMIYRLHPIPIDSIHTVTLYVIVLGAFLFSFGGAIALSLSGFLISTRIKLVPAPKSSGKFFSYMLLWILFFGVCFQTRALFSAAARGSGDGFMASARVAVVENMVEEEQGVRNPDHWLTYVTLWTIYTAILFKLEHKGRLFWIASALALTSCITTTGRAQIMMLFSALLCVHLIQANGESFLGAFRLARWPIIAFCALFGVLAYTNKNTSGASGGTLGFISAAVIGYIIGPLPSLDQVLTHLSDYGGMPNHTFAFFEKILVQFGFMSAVPPMSLGNLFVPFFSNVYTIYAFFITDFGSVGAMLIMALIGFVHVLLYRKAHAESILGLFLFSLTIYPLIMSIFADLYTTLGIYVSGMLFAVSYCYLRSVSILGGLNHRQKRVELP